MSQPTLRRALELCSYLISELRGMDLRQQREVASLETEALEQGLDTQLWYLVSLRDGFRADGVLPKETESTDAFLAPSESIGTQHLPKPGVAVSLRTRNLGRAVELCLSLNSILQGIDALPVRESKSMDELLRRLQAIFQLRNHLLSPCARLHDDILSYIFAEPYWQDWPSCHKVAFAKSLYGVSSRFQQLALSTPHLWATIRIGDSAMLDALSRTAPRQLSISEGRAQMCKEWIGRAKAIPLTVYVGRSIGREVPDVLEALLASLSTGLSSIRRLYWTLPFTEFLMQAISYCSPSLEVLHVTRDILPPNPQGIEELFTTSMPALKEVALHSVRLPQCLDTLTGCTSLTFSFVRDTVPTINQFIGLLRVCNRLEHLTLMILNWVDRLASEPKPKPVDLLALKSLDLNEYPGSQSLLSVLQAPSLSKLVLRRGYLRPGIHAAPNMTEAMNIYPPLKEFLLSSPRIESVEFSDSSPNKLLNTLIYLPAVRSLSFTWTLQEQDLSIDLFGDAKLRMASLCPRLESLKLFINDALSSKPASTDHLASQLHALLQTRQTYTLISDIRNLEVRVPSDDRLDPLRPLMVDVHCLILNGRKQSFDTWR